MELHITAKETGRLIASAPYNHVLRFIMPGRIELEEDSWEHGKLMDLRKAGQFDYIKKYYGVSPEVGMTVTLEGKREGKVTGANGEYLMVDFGDGPRPCHPVWEMEYHHKAVDLCIAPPTHRDTEG